MFLNFNPKFQISWLSFNVGLALADKVLLVAIVGADFNFNLENFRFLWSLKV